MSAPVYVIYISFSLIFFAEIIYGEIEFIDYLSFLVKVKKSYKATGLFFLYDTQSERFSSQIKIVQFFKQLSDLNLLSQAMRYSRIREISSFYFAQNLQSLFVVFIASQVNLDDFRAATAGHDMSFHTWLVIFESKDLNEICLNPTGNLFNLDFDSKMLVWCDYGIQEWYSLHQNHTKILDFVERSEELGIFRNEDRYLEQRYDMTEKTLKIATINNNLNGKMMELFEDVFSELVQSMKFTVDRARVINSFGKWSDLLGYLADHQVDLVLAPITITASRLDLIDFTKPLILSPHLIYFRQPDGGSVQWSSYFRAFSLSSWLFIALTLITASLMIAFIKIMVNETAFLQISMSYLVENFISIWGIYCQQGISEIPSVIPLRLAYFSTLVLTLVVWAIYSASITSYLTVLSPGLPFSDVEGLVKDGSYRLIVVRNSSDQDIILSGEDPILAKLRPLLKNPREFPANPTVGFQQVCYERVAFYASEAVLKDVDPRIIPCTLSFIETGQFECLAMALIKRSPYVNFINYNLQKLTDTGVIKKLKSRYFSKINKLESSHHSPVELWSVVPLLVIFAIGFFLSGLILILEYFCRFDRKRRIDSTIYGNSMYI